MLVHIKVSFYNVIFTRPLPNQISQSGWALFGLMNASSASSTPRNAKVGSNMFVPVIYHHCFCASHDAVSQVYNNAGNGIMLHRSCDRAKLFDNYSHDNEDAGLALYESSNCQVYDNKFYFNKRESNTGA